MQCESNDGDEDYMLVSEACMDHLYAPIKRSARLKFNCISVSSKLVVIGANTGGVYVFSKHDRNLLQIAFADKETNGVTHIRISPHEKYVAFACGSNVHVLDLRLESRSKAETLRSSTDRGVAMVTYLLWDPDPASTKLYIGDDSGSVFVMPVYSNKAMNLFSLPLETIMKLDSAVVQMDKAGGKILVSTLTRCYLCDTSKHTYSQIGKKLRDGSFGACFLQLGTSAPMIYSARPSSRIWEVDFEGNVLNTHQFKQLLVIPAVTVIHTDRPLDIPNETNSPPQSLSFPKLIMLQTNLLLTWTSSSIYVLDPVNVKVIMWCNSYSGVLDVCCVKEQLYIFLQTMEVHCVSFLPVTAVIPLYMKTSNLEAAAHLCLRNKHIFLHKHVRKRFGIKDLSQISERLINHGMGELGEKINGVIREVENKVSMETETESTDSSRSAKSRTGSIISDKSIESEKILDESEKSVDVEKDQNPGIAVETNVPVDMSENVTNEERKVINTDMHTPYNCDQSEVHVVNGVVQDDEQENNGAADEIDGALVKLSEDKNQLAEHNINSHSHNINTLLNTDNQGLNIVEGVASDTLNNNTGGLTKTSDPDQSEEMFANDATSNMYLGEHSQDTVHTGVTMVTENNQSDVNVEAEDIGILPDYGPRPRRPSLTSLSSLSSAEVSLDQPSTYEIPVDEVDNEVIARPVRKNQSRKKRNSSGDVRKEKTGRTRRSLSVGALQNTPSLKEGAMTPPGSSHNVIEEDSISIYSTDSLTLDDPGRLNSCHDDSRESADNTSLERNLDTLSVGSPMTTSGDFSHSPDMLRSEEFFSKSGDFCKSGEYSESGEFTSRGTTPSSAPKAVLKNFKEKVKSKGKNIMKNIKEKNLVTKAKGLMENLSQGSEAYLNSGEVPYMETPRIIIDLDPGSRSDVKTTSLPSTEGQSLDEADGACRPVVDLSKLEHKTAHTKDKMTDLEILLDPDLMYKTLADWVTVLNETFYDLHVQKYGTQSEMKGKDEQTNCRSENKSNQIQTNGTTQDSAINTESRVFHELKGTSRDSSETSLNQPGAIISNILIDSQFCYIKDPLGLSRQMLENVSELAQACFDLSCHGDILSYQRLCCQGQGCLKHVTEGCLVDENGVSDISHDMEHSDLQKQDDTKQNLTDIVVDDEKVCKNENIANLPTDKQTSCDETLDIPINALVNSDLNKTSEFDLEQANGHQDNVVEGQPDLMSVSKEIQSSGNHTVKVDDSEDLTGQSVNSNDSGNCNNSISRSTEDSTHEKQKNTIVTNDEDSVNNLCDKFDLSMEYFVRCYLPYIQPCRVRQEVLAGTVGYNTWCALVAGMEVISSEAGERYGIEEKSIITYLLENLAMQDHGAALLGHIFKLFQRKSTSVLDIAVRCHPYIQPLDVMYMCQYHCVAMDTVFKQYMMWMTGQATSTVREEVLERVRRQPDVFLTWLDMLLAEDWSPDVYLDHTGYARCMSHKATWKNGAMIEKLIKTERMGDRFLQLFNKYGYWQGVLRILKETGRTQEHVELILRLGDIGLLSNQSDIGYVATSIEEWNQLLHSFKVTGSQSLYKMSSDWPEKITWNNLAILLVRQVGPEEAVSLLERFEVPEELLTADFYQSCLLAGMVHKHQRNILHTMLERIDTYLWSQRPTAVSPQVHYLAVSERSQQSANNKHQDIIHSLTNQLKECTCTEQYIEDQECHWGVQTKINLLCPCCNIALKEPVSHDTPGVLLFKCGHGYHKMCLPSKHCFVCDL